MWNSSTSMPFAVSRARFAMPSRSSNRSRARGRVRRHVELVEAELQRRRLLAVDIEQARLDVVARGRIVALAEVNSQSLRGDTQSSTVAASTFIASSTSTSIRSSARSSGVFLGETLMVGMLRPVPAARRTET